MAEILGKDLDKWDDSLAARQPFALKESDVSGPQYLTGSDFVRSAKISPEWKLPVNNQIPKVTQPIITMGEAVVDTVVNYVPNLKNLAAQRAIELTTGEEMPETLAGRLTKGTEIGRLQDDVARIIGLGMIGADALINRKEYEEKAKTYDEAVELVNNRDYPLTKYARRVLAETTNQVETRRVVRELYNQSRGIYSSAWYNQAGSIIGAMIPTIVVSRGVGATARAFGASRIGATNAALNATKGIVAGQMAGDYAEETAAEYLERTGDTTFENFTAKDATGLSAMAYGAIAGQIEVFGGIEPIMAGAVSKVGLRSGLLKAGAKVGLQEAAEEFLQGMAEFFTRKIDRSTEKTWGEAFKEALTGAVWGLFIGGPMGTGAFYINRRNLTKGIKKGLPNISDTQATQIADAMIDNAAEASSQDPTLRNNLREKVALMYRDIDMDNKEDRIDAMTDLEYSLIAMDAIDRGIDIADHELFQGVVNELGWFRAGIPEAEMGKIESINNNIRELRTQLEELNKAEEKDWAKIEETENKLAQASQYVLENLTDVRKAFQELEDKYVEKEFKATPEQIELSSKTATDIFDTLSNEGVDIQFANQGKTTKDAATYLQINRKGAKSFQIRFGVSPIGPLHPSVVANFNVETLTQEQILQHIRTLIENKYPRTNKKAKEGVNIGFGEQPMFQNRVSGAAPKTYRGAYIPEYRFILRANKMDASTLSHELAHDWMEVNFARYRSGKQGKDFMKAWGALEKALGIPENATSVPRKASETFARAYEAWIVQNEDWAKLIAVEDKDKDAVEKLMKDYQGELRDIYNDITNPYFKQTWGKIGELKPELKAWFDRVVNITDLDTMVERGEMTESQAANEKLNRAIDTVIKNTTDSDTKQALTEAKVLNDTSRYEVEGGNKNSIQQRLSVLAKDIDENNMVLKGEKYDTRRDMMQVAEAADNFVKTRLDDALAIINGEMAETEGLYKEDLYTALERLAVENGDLNLIDELKNSEVANRLAKELGQRVAGFRNIKQSTDIDVVSALKSLDMKFNKALDNKKAKQEYDAALKLLDESMKQQDKIADKELDNFLDELECK